MFPKMRRINYNENPRRRGVPKRPASLSYPRTFDHYYRFVPAIIDFASTNQLLDSPPIKPPRIVKLACSVLNNYMTIRVEGENGMTVDYDARVLSKPANMGFEVLSVKKAEHSERITNSIMLSDENEEGGIKVASGVDIPKLCTSGFFILLNQIRSEKPTLSFKMARKAAKSAWNKLTEPEKVRLMSVAAKKRKEKGEEGERPEKGSGSEGTKDEEVEGP